MLCSPFFFIAYPSGEQANPHFAFIANKASTNHRPFYILKQGGLFVVVYHSFKF